MDYKKITHWSLFTIIIVYVISGLGITRYRIIEPLTFGLLTKAVAFKLHSYLLIPFLILLIAHVTLTMNRKK